MPYLQMIMITCNTSAGTEIDLNEQKHTFSVFSILAAMNIMNKYENIHTSCHWNT